MNRFTLLGLVVGLTVLTVRPSLVFAEESTTDKVQDTTGDAKTSVKKTGRAVKRQVRKATGNDTAMKDAKDKVNDAGDDISNGAEKLKRKAE